MSNYEFGALSFVNKFGRLCTRATLALIGTLVFIMGVCTFQAHADEPVPVDPVPTWFSSDTDSTNVMAWADLDGDGDLDLIAGNGLFRPGWSTSREHSKLYINEDGALTPEGVEISEDPSITMSVAWGDIDGDGDLDLALGNHSGSNKVYINNYGELDSSNPWSDEQENDNTYSIAWADMDGNGYLDLIVGNYGSFNKIYFNQDGVLQKNNVWTDNKNDNTRSIAVGDVDGDGDIDLAVGNGGHENEGCPSQQNRLYLNHLKQDGSFKLIPTDIFAGTASCTYSLAWGDVDNKSTNGRFLLELAVGNYGAPNKVYYFTLNDREELQLQPVAWTDEVNDFTRSVAWGDVDGDGYIDLATVSSVVPLIGVPQDGQIKIYPNTGGILEKEKMWISAVSPSIQSVAWGDVDGDGNLDLAASVTDSSHNRLYRNHGGPFTSGNLWTSVDSDRTSSIAWGDLDNDGDLDLIAGNVGPNKTYVNRNGELEPIGQQFSDDNHSTHSIAIGDVNNDDYLDLVVGNAIRHICHRQEGRQFNRLYLNDKQGNLLQAGSIIGNIIGEVGENNPPDCTKSIALGDVNGDGHLDLAVGNGENNWPEQNRLYINDGNGNFQRSEWAPDVNGDGRPDADRTFSVAWGDMDRDGDLDLAVSNELEPNYLYENQNGMLDNIPIWRSEDNDATGSAAWGDVDGDGDLDLAVRTWSGPNKVYLNERGILGASAAWFSQDSENTISSAWGDSDGDGDLDLAAGNQNTDRLYINEKGSLRQEGLILNDPEESSWSSYSIAWGDVDNDGDLDLAVGVDPENDHDDRTNKIYINRRNGGYREALNYTSYIHIAHPGTTGRANFYSSPDVIEERFIPITYSLIDPDNDRVSHIKAFYSMDGGDNWQPAIATTDTITTNVPTGIQTYTWDTFRSGFFGQSDNLVFRMVAYSQPPTITTTSPRTYLYTNMVAGPYQRPYVSAHTFPFRVRGAQLQVLQENGTPAADAIVYNLRAGQSNAQPMGGINRPFRTNFQGYLEGRGELGDGDLLVALQPISTTRKFTLYHTSAAVEPIEPLGLKLFKVEADQLVVRKLTVSEGNPLLLFNLVLSLEWDARNETVFLGRLEADLKRTSEFLYDWTNGQAALGDITLYHNKQKWDEADIRIYANNRLRPNASQGGIVDGEYIDPDAQKVIYKRGLVRMGATWNRYGDATGSVGDDWPRALAHELGHFLFFLDDNYIGFDGNDNFVSVKQCHGAMFNPYLDSESEFYPVDNMGWDGECANSFSNRFTGRSDWETINTLYLDIWDIALNIPAVNFTEVFTGPGNLPLAVTRIIPAPSNDDPPAAESPIISLAQNGTSVTTGNSARAFLFQNDRIVDLGRPIAGEILARGARINDRLCVFELEVQPPRLGCELVSASDDELELHEKSGWRPEIIVDPKTTKQITVNVRNVPDDVCDTCVKARLYPVDEVVPQEQPMSPDGTDSTFTATFRFEQEVVAGYIQVWVEEGAPRREIVTDFALGGGPVRSGSRASAFAPVISADGQVLLYGNNLNFLGDEFYSLQAATVIPAAQSWTQPVGQAFRLIASENAPDLKNNTSIVFNYLENEVPARGETWLRIYYYNESNAKWELLPTKEGGRDTEFNYIAAPVQGEGLYALMATIETPPLNRGWEEFAYPDTDPRPVPEALASIGKNYTSVYWRNGDQWLLYDRTVQPGFAGLVNDDSDPTTPVSEPLIMRPLESYWIYVVQTGTVPYIGVPSEQEVIPSNVIQLPPATFYGWVEATDAYTPHAGDPVIAKIDNIVCGVGQVLEYDPLRHGSQIYSLRPDDITRIYFPMMGTVPNPPVEYVYKIQIRADTGDRCGVFGREIEFQVGNVVLPSNHPWGNSQACFHPLGPPTQRPYTCFTFAAPDLVVKNLEVTPNNVRVEIANQGTAAVPPGTGFWVDVYINPSRAPIKVNETWEVIAQENNIPRESAQGLVWNVKELSVPLEPGQTLTFEIGDENYRPDHSNFSGQLSPDDMIYVQVDSANEKTDYGGVLEVHEMVNRRYNNIRAYPERTYLPLMFDE